MTSGIQTIAVGVVVPTGNEGRVIQFTRTERLVGDSSFFGEMGDWQTVGCHSAVSLRLL